MRLIDADELIKKMLREGDTYTNDDIGHGYHNCQILVYDAPTVDAEPVRHGKWKIKEINTFELSYGATGYEPVYQCSECGGVEESYLRLDEPIMPEDANFPRYCPHCGALMDEVEE